MKKEKVSSNKKYPSGKIWNRKQRLGTMIEPCIGMALRGPRGFICVLLHARYLRECHHDLQSRSLAHGHVLSVFRG